MSELTIYGFETSNNLKVRIALGLKEIPYRFVTVDPAEREQLQALSRQSLTPLLQHGDVVLGDSAAILRYLDANFAQGPRLFGASRTEQWAIEDWEFFARTELAGPMMHVVHSRVNGTPLDAEATAREADAFAAACARLAAQLAEKPWILGDAITAADVTAAPVLWRVQSSGVLPWPQEAASLEAWQARVMAYDGRARLS